MRRGGVTSKRSNAASGHAGSVQRRECTCSVLSRRLQGTDSASPAAHGSGAPERDPPPCTRRVAVADPTAAGAHGRAWRPHRAADTDSAKDFDIPGCARLSFCRLWQALTGFHAARAGWRPRTATGWGVSLGRLSGHGVAADSISVPTSLPNHGTGTLPSLREGSGTDLQTRRSRRIERRLRLSARFPSVHSAPWALHRTRRVL
jgi:hypothetical protein